MSNKSQSKSQNSKESTEGVVKLTRHPYANLADWQESVNTVLSMKFGNPGKAFASEDVPPYRTMTLNAWVRAELAKQPLANDAGIEDEISIAIKASQVPENVKAYNRLNADWDEKAPMIFAFLMSTLVKDSKILVTQDTDYDTHFKDNDFISLKKLIVKKHLYIGVSASTGEKDRLENYLRTFLQGNMSTVKYVKKFREIHEQGTAMGIGWVESKVVYWFITNSNPEIFKSRVVEIEAGEKPGPATIEDAYAEWIRRDHAAKRANMQMGSSEKSKDANTFLKVQDEKKQRGGASGKSGKGRKGQPKDGGGGKKTQEKSEQKAEPKDQKPGKSNAGGAGKRGETEEKGSKGDQPPASAHTVMRVVSVALDSSTARTAASLESSDVDQTDTILDSGANTSIFMHREHIEGVHRLPHSTRIEGVTGTRHLSFVGTHFLCGETYLDEERRYNIVSLSNVRDAGWSVHYDSGTDVFTVGGLRFYRRREDGLYWCERLLGDITRDMLGEPAEAVVAEARVESPIGVPEHKHSYALANAHRHGRWADFEENLDDEGDPIPPLYDSEDEEEEPSLTLPDVDAAEGLLNLFDSRTASNARTYTRAQRDMAMKVDRLHQALNHPSDDRLATLLEGREDELSSSDVRLAREILGPCTHCAAGKLVDKKKKKKDEKSGSEKHKAGELWHIDILFFDSFKFLFGVEDSCEYWDIIELSSRGEGEVLRAVQELVDNQARKGHQIKVIRSDREPSFIAIKNALADMFIKLQLTASGKHNVLIERNVRTFRGYSRSTMDGLGFPMPRNWIPWLAKDVVLTHNSLPNAHTGNLTPMQIIEGWAMSLTELCKFKFGTPMVVRDLNAPKFRTQKGFVVGRNPNTKRSLSIMLWGSHRVVNREPGSPIAITTDVKGKIQELVALHDVAPGLISNVNEEDSDTEIDVMDFQPPPRDDDADIDLPPLDDFITHEPRLEEGAGAEVDNEDLAIDAAIDNLPEMAVDVDRPQDGRGYTYAPEAVAEQEARAASYWEPSNDSRRTTNMAKAPQLTEEQEAAILIEFDQLYGPKAVIVPVSHVPKNVKHNKILPNLCDVKAKYDPVSGLLLKWKGRICIMGNFAPENWYEFAEKVSYMATSPSIKIFIHVSAKFKFVIGVTDIPGAYLNAILRHPYFTKFTGMIVEIIIRAHPELKDFLQPDGSILFRVDKALYGLPDSGARWALDLRQYLHSLGFESCLADRNVYRHPDFQGHGIVMLIVHVDDILMSAATKVALEAVVATFSQRFGDMELKAGNDVPYLGCVISKEDNGYSMHMAQFIESLGEKFPELKAKPQQYPHGPEFMKANPPSPPISQKTYLSLLMSLMWVATKVRTDILFNCSVLASRAKAPTERDYQDVIKVGRYLYSTRHYRLHIEPGPMQITLSVDASFRSHPDLKGHSGALIQFDGRGVLAGQSNKQKELATSSTHSELIGLQGSIDETDFCVQITDFLGIPQGPVPTQQDNQAAGSVAITGGSKHGKLKHVLAKLYRVREAVDLGLIRIVDTRTSDIRADCLTKPIQGAAFHSFVRDTLRIF